MMNREPDQLNNASIQARAWSAVAWIAVVFCVAVGLMLIFQRATAVSSNPWKSPQLLQLKRELAAAPKNEGLKQRIRELDLSFRQRFFRRLALDRTGGVLLVAGVGVALLAARRARALRWVPAVPTAAPNALVWEKAAARARWAVAGVGLVLGAGFAAGAAWQQTQSAPVAAKAPAVEKPAPVEEVPGLAEFRANWPRFRGPDGNGASAQVAGPLSWSETSGVIWKAPVPRAGFNSPIIWGDRVFLSGGDAEKRAVLAYSAADGKLLWERLIENVPGSPAQAPEVPEMTGFAAPTMATDGKRVYAIFANGDLAALTLEGAPVWSKNLGVPKNQYGHATSLAVWKGRLIVQMDQGDDKPANSRLSVFDGATGKVVWEKPRQTPGSWASPAVVEVAGRAQILTAALPSVIAYDVETGAELWKADVLEGEVTPSPILAGGLVCAISPTSKVMGLKADGSGDVTASAVAWSAEENVPDIASPATDGTLIFLVSGNGLLTCLDAATGAKQWEHDFGSEVQASPGIAGGRVYVISTEGKAWVVAAEREFKELGQGELEDHFFASPAFAGGRLFLRGNASLYCLGDH